MIQEATRQLFIVLASKILGLIIFLYGITIGYTSFLEIRLGDFELLNNIGMAFFVMILGAGLMISGVFIMIKKKCGHKLSCVLALITALLFSYLLFVSLVETSSLEGNVALLGALLGAPVLLSVFILYQQICYFKGERKSVF